jgi:transposase
LAFILPYTLTGIGPSEVASASFPIRRAATGVRYASDDGTNLHLALVPETLTVRLGRPSLSLFAQAGRYLRLSSPRFIRLASLSNPPTTQGVRMIDAYVGIDISKAKFDATALTSAFPPQHKSFPNNPDGFEDLMLWLANNTFSFDSHFCMEATGRYGEALSNYLFDAGQSVSVVNPSCIKNYARSKLRRTKTDKVDSALIAEYCSKEKPSLWQPLPKHSRDLQQLTRELEHLKRLLADEKSRSKAGSHIPSVKDSIASLMTFLEAQIELLEREIATIIDSHKTLKRQKTLLLTIPGIGPTTAHALLSEIPDISKFKSAKQVVSFAGLVPRENSSGTLQGKTRLSKVGSSRLRRALYMPAVSAKRYNPVIIALCSRIESSGKSKMVAIGASMRKLLHIVFGVLKSNKPFNKKLHSLEA